MRRARFAYLLAPMLALFALQPAGVNAVVSGQSESEYAASYATHHVANASATTQRTSCYTPEVSAAAYNDAPAYGASYSGESPCAGAANTGENLGPYASQAGSNPGYPMTAPQLVKDHSESDLRVDPTNPMHLIGSSKWIVSAEGYNHLLGFYESWDGGVTWPAQGHIPGYEGWTDNTDPVGAFDTWGNYYSLNLAYQFFYNSDGSHNFQINTNREPNPTLPAEIISLATRPHGSRNAQQWVTTHNGNPDYVATYDSKGHEPDKQWITVDTNPRSPHRNRIYAMWVDFVGPYTANPYISYADARPDGSHTDWSSPQPLPVEPNTPQGATYLLPHVTPDGSLWTTLVNTAPKQKFTYDKIFVDVSTDGGKTFSITSSVAENIIAPPYRYANTTFRDGILESFATGNTLVNGHYPLYVGWEDYSAGVVNILLSGSFDGGYSWTAPVQVNDNRARADEFQPSMSVTPSGRLSVAFYDRRLACPSAGSSEAGASGIALDTYNPNWSGSFPPYGATNYCVNSSVQYYDSLLRPLGQNIRLTQHTWDPQLNAPHSGSPTGLTTFIGDYFGNAANASTNYFTFVSTYNYGANSAYRQQQVVAAVAVP